MMHPRFRPLAAVLSAALLLGPALAAASDHVPAKAAKPAKAEEGAPPTKVASAAPEATTADPLDTLRQRLAERLSATRAGESPNDMRVTTKAAAASAARPEGARAAAHGRAGAQGRQDRRTRGGAWRRPLGLQRHGRPAAWAGLKPEFSLCGAGQRQSPIDIRGGLAVDLDPVRFDYQASRFAVVDNGHTVQVNVAPGNTIEVGGKRFELLQFHLHRPSEERIDGRQFEMSLHLVHKDEQGALAVVALLFEKGPANAVLQKVWNNLPLERNEGNGRARAAGTGGTCCPPTGATSPTWFAHHAAVQRRRAVDRDAPAGDADAGPDRHLRAHLSDERAAASAGPPGAASSQSN